MSKIMEWPTETLAQKMQGWEIGRMIVTDYTKKSTPVVNRKEMKLQEIFAELDKMPAAGSAEWKSFDVKPGSEGVYEIRHFAPDVPRIFYSSFQGGVWYKAGFKPEEAKAATTISEWVRVGIVDGWREIQPAS